MRPKNHPLTSVKFPCNRGTFRQLPSNFRAPARSYVYFCQIAVRQASVNFPYYRASMHSVSVRRLYACPQDHLSTYHASEGRSDNFRQLSVHLRDHASKFRVSVAHSVHFPFVCGTFRQVWSTIRAALGPFVNFPCIRETFSQLSVHPQDLPFHASAGPYVNLYQLSVFLRNLPSFSVHPRDLL